MKYEDEVLVQVVSLLGKAKHFSIGQHFGNVRYIASAFCRLNGLLYTKQKLLPVMRDELYSSIV